VVLAVLRVLAVLADRAALMAVMATQMLAETPLPVMVVFMVAVLAKVLAVELEAEAVVLSVLFGAITDISHLRIPATYECAGSYCYCCLG
jgi:delta 1-pyrroline-5-carboxylate dehydrogenase